MEPNQHLHEAWKGNSDTETWKLSWYYEVGSVGIPYGPSKWTKVQIQYKSSLGGVFITMVPMSIFSRNSAKSRNDYHENLLTEK